MAERPTGRLLDRVQSDLRYARMIGGVLRRFVRAAPWRGTTLADVIEHQVDRTPLAEALRFDGGATTYRELDERANQYAHWARSSGVLAGDVVGLLLPNEPGFVFALLGLAKIGAVGALLNTNLRGRALAHCINLAQPGHMIVSPELADAYASARGELDRTPTPWFVGGEAADGEDLEAAVSSSPTDRPDRSIRAGTRAQDRLCYIYTSGTSGLPKAANITHFRYLGAAVSAAGMARISADDRSYVALPLYHAAGVCSALGGALTSGATAVLARRFSASRFWVDCVEHRATLFQYIGELCRFLLNQPERPEEREHAIRICVGNGLRTEVWEPFQERFRIPEIVEFYGATEGNVAVINLDNKIGSIGRVPPRLRSAMGIRLLKYDVERDELVRDAAGRYVESDPGEAGEAIGKISALVGFDGYSDDEATEKKVLRDVFRRGDAYFRTGDLLRVDEQGYFYFVDRIGDTFRWRGENVSTLEVAEVLAGFPAVRDVAVYGVNVPGNEGRAGLAALVIAGELDRKAFAEHVRKSLAAYARPVFLRLLPQIVTTGTFKHRKVELVGQGFDPSRIDDPLLFLDPQSGSYEPLDSERFEELVAAHVRV